MTMTTARWGNYVLTGPEDMVRGATREEVEEAVIRMRREQHSNRARVEEILKRRDSVPVVYLRAYERAHLNDSMREYLLRHGVVRAYSPEPKVPAKAQRVTAEDADHIDNAITSLESADGDLEVALRGVPDVTLLDIIDALRTLSLSAEEDEEDEDDD
jgi:hypothetical protein